MDGKVIIFSAPSGAGKTTVVRHLLQSRNDLAFSVSATTREPRNGELDGRDYHFISKADFEAKVHERAFVEWEQVYSGSYYGTLKTEVERIWLAGKHVVFDVDVVGGVNLCKIYGDQALGIFIKPPSLQVLAERLAKRGTESPEKLQERVAKAERELAYEGEFNAVLVNDDLAVTLKNAEDLVSAFLES
ncbi:MAG: guanylate kinase [Bacteroidetes bacterium]|nr:MAG: guanylate kinase [Bacteroidota bacterium]